MTLFLGLLGSLALSGAVYFGRLVVELHQRAAELKREGERHGERGVDASERQEFWESYQHHGRAKDCYALATFCYLDSALPLLASMGCAGLAVGAFAGSFS